MSDLMDVLRELYRLRLDAPGEPRELFALMDPHDSEVAGALPNGWGWVSNLGGGSGAQIPTEAITGLRTMGLVEDVADPPNAFRLTPAGLARGADLSAG